MSIKSNIIGNTCNVDLIQTAQVSFFKGTKEFYFIFIAFLTDKIIR